jgi:hypothetical protein
MKKFKFQDLLPLHQTRVAMIETPHQTRMTVVVPPLHQMTTATVVELLVELFLLWLLLSFLL